MKTAKEMQYTNHPYRLLSSGKKLIGWGSGGVFDYFQSLFPLPLAYLVDNAQDKQGTSKAGVEILPPKALEHEDPEQTVVVIYSSFSVEIFSQLKSYGNFTAINAPVLFCNDYDQQWQKIGELLVSPIPKRLSHEENAILIQGQVVPELTLKIAGLYARQYPDSLRVLSTWQGTDETLLNEIAPLVDKILLNPLPQWFGVQNRNLQIISTYEGLLYCQQQGSKRALKTRSDMFIMSPDILMQCEKLLNYYTPDSCRQWGALNRLVVPESFTRKYLPYSPSDLAMYGTIEDLSRFWSCPLDERRFDLLETCQTHSLRQLGCKGLPAECYFGIHYCHSLNRPLPGNLHDSWNFYRDFFLVTDNSLFKFFWPKNPHIPDSIPQQQHRETVSHKFWNRLINSKQQQKIDINITLQNWS